MAVSTIRTGLSAEPRVPWGATKMARQSNHGRAALINAKWTAIDGRRVRYIEDGPRNGPDTLLLAAVKLETLAEIWPAMIEASRVVAIEFPGRGPSSDRTGLLQPFEMAPFVLRTIDRFRLRHPHLIVDEILAATAFITMLEHPDAVESVVVSGALAAHDTELRTSMSAQDRRPARWVAVAENLAQITKPTLVIVDEHSAWWTDAIKVLSATLPKCRLVAFGGHRVEYGNDRLLYAALVRVWVNGSYRCVEAEYRLGAS
jgi:pimeloyl-ACP methyl ester carboxylesterase